MTGKIRVPKFTSQVIEGNRKDGYWVETIKFHKDDKAPGIITSGLVSGLVEYLENPVSTGKSTSCTDSEWTKYEIGKFNSPVGVACADITKNGLMDVIVCHNYGPFMLECDPDGGHITWLENPGREGLKDGVYWKQHYIGRWPAMHRIKVGHFTQKSYLEVIAASVVCGPADKTTPIPIIRFQSPDTAVVRDALEWQHDVVDDENFTVIHEVTVKKLDGPHGLDSMFISSREGLTRLYYADQKWHRDLIGIGEPQAPGQSPSALSPGSGDHWGTGCADAGRIGGDPYAYIATLDPFHGTTCCVYTKVKSAFGGPAEWKRTILDVYGTPNQLQHYGDGPGHFILCADFDGDGDEEFLLSLFGSLDRDSSGESIKPHGGPNPNKGIMYYKAIDLEKGIWYKTKIAAESSARIAMGDFNGHGRIDLVSMSYNVARYYEEPDPVVTLHLNDFSPTASDLSTATITTTVWDGEDLVYVPNPSTATLKQSLSQSLIEIANYAINVVVIPAGAEYKVDGGAGIRVLWGSVIDGDQVREPFSVPAFTASSSTVESGSLTADKKKGAVILLINPVGDTSKVYRTAEDVPVTNTLNVSHTGLAPPELNFVKVDSTWWGSTNKFFKGVDFYNLTGVSVRFADQTPIAHLQWWTAAQNVNCGVHNHTDAMFQEIHVSLSAGTGNGGMYRLKPGHENDTTDELNALPAEEFDQLPLKQLEEHGGMWIRDSYGNAVRGANDVIKYPYHKWQAGCGSKGVDVWMAVEYNPALSRFPDGSD